jgi:hypothetical protein
MTSRHLVVAFPARSSRDWRGRTAWGRDAHLLEAAMRHLGPHSQLVAVVRTPVGRGRGPGEVVLGEIRGRAVTHRFEVPGWSRRRLSAAVTRRLGARLPAVPAAPEGLVLCFDPLRHEAAVRLARSRGWQLVTDLMDDWREHASIPGWHGHLARRVYPAMPARGDLLTSVTALAAEPRPALIVPNAGHHEDAPPHAPSERPARPVAAFVGTVHPRLDAGMLIELRRRLTGWDVVAAGPVMDRAVAARLVAGGVRLEAWWEMAEVDRRATVVVCPYVRTRFTLSGDPLKVYESTARGVPCVSTIPVGVPPETGLVVAGDAEAFADAVHAARLLDRTDVARAARATGSWEDRARAVLDAVESQRPAVERMVT